MIFDSLSQLEMYIPLLPEIRLIVDILDHDNLYDMPCGTRTTRDKRVTYTITEGPTTTTDRPFEYHKHHTDVIIILHGQELLSTSWRELQIQAESFDTATDTGFFVAEPLSVLQAAQGRFAIFFPGEPHKSNIAIGEPSIVKKVLFQIEE